jgi:hypothetical protein
MAVEREMTFALLRAGLPNSAVALALGVVPLVALALSPAHRAPAHSGQIIVAAASQNAGQAVLN